MLHRKLFPVLFDEDPAGGAADPPAGDPPPADPPADPPAADPPASKKPPWEGEELDPERATKLFEGLSADKERLKQRAEAAEAKIREAEDAKKTDQQKLEDRIKELEPTAKEVLQLRVALDKGLSRTQAKRLVGETEEDLAKDADELLESFKDEGDGNGQDPPRRPRERLRPGAAPSAEPDESDPAKLAAEVPRGW